MATLLEQNISEGAWIFPYPAPPGVFNLDYNVRPGGGVFGDYDTNYINFRLFFGDPGSEVEVDISDWSPPMRDTEAVSSVMLFSTLPSQSDMPPGRYRIDIEHYEVDTDPPIFTRTTEVTFTESGTLFSAGTKEYFADGKQYNVVHSKNTTVTISPSGLVQFTAPATKNSFNGQNTCYRHVVNGMHAEVPSAERNALLGSGLNLPEGNYTYYFIYANTSGGGSNYNQIFGDGEWTLFSNANIELNGQSAQQNRSARFECISISVVRIVETPDDVLRPPKSLRVLSWLPSFQESPYNLSGFPTPQSFGITKVLTIGKTNGDRQVGVDRNISKGFRTQYIYSELDGKPAGSKWRNVQAKTPGPSTDPVAIANTFYGGRQLMATMEVAENVGNDVGCPPCWSVAQQTSVQWNNKATADGATSPQDHENYGDYFQDTHGEGNYAMYRTEANGHMLMQNQTNARLMHILPLETDNYAQSGYFTSGQYNVRNWLQGGYLDSPTFRGKARWIYDLIFGLERKFMAAPDRKVMTYAAATYEGVHCDTIRDGTDLRLFFPVENGDLIRRSKMGLSWDTMYTHALWTFLFGASYIVWDGSGFDNIDPYGFSWGMWGVNVDSNGDPIPSSIRWQPTGAGSDSQYNSGNPAHPTRDVGQSGSFPNDVSHGQNGAFAAALAYKFLRVDNDYMSNTIEYGNYSFTKNGGPVTNGYNGTNAPITGANGAKFTRYGAANAGQSNIVTISWYEKPILAYFNGADGSGVVFQNPHAASTDVHVVTCTNGGGKTFTAVGNMPHIELF